MSEAGNTGYAGGTKGASPVPEPTTAPDGSTVIEEQPQPKGDEQNAGYPNGDEKGVADDGRAVG